MIFGSFIAGATSEGGGAIAFPVFTKLLHISPQDAKIFAYAIQSVGMGMASITIFLLKIPLAWRIVTWATLGGAFGLLVGAGMISPLLEPALIKMLFTSMAVSFALVLTMINWQSREYVQSLNPLNSKNKLIVLLTGFIGGMMTGLVGTGIDIICFSVMVLYYQLPEKIATPTSVVLMTFNSWIGLSVQHFTLGGIPDHVVNYWLAAIPVVVVGAPLGAFLCSRMQNQTIASVLILLIIIEFCSSLYLLPMTDDMIVISSLVFFIFTYICYRMSIAKQPNHLIKGE